jgi:hypothetical protein
MRGQLVDHGDRLRRRRRIRENPPVGHDAHETDGDENAQTERLWSVDQIVEPLALWAVRLEIGTMCVYQDVHIWHQHRRQRSERTSSSSSTSDTSAGVSRILRRASPCVGMEHREASRRRGANASRNASLMTALSGTFLFAARCLARRKSSSSRMTVVRIRVIIRMRPVAVKLVAVSMRPGALVVDQAQVALGDDGGEGEADVGDVV